VSISDPVSVPVRLMRFQSFLLPTWKRDSFQLGGLKLFDTRTKRSPDEPLAVGFEKAGQLTGLGQTKLRELAKDGTLETIHVGARNLILYASLKKLVGA
jgi:hypothetical protein